MRGGRLLRQIAACDLDRTCSGVAFEHAGSAAAVAHGWPANRDELVPTARAQPLKVLYVPPEDAACPFAAGCATWAKHSVMAQLRLRGGRMGGGGL